MRPRGENDPRCMPTSDAAPYPHGAGPADAAGPRPTTPGILDAALTVRARYASLKLDLVDAVNVALAAEYDTDAVLTRNLRDFRPVRPVGGRHTCFRVLPDDL